MVKCTESGCEILDSKTAIPVATRVECLYHLSCQSHNEQANAAVNKSKESKEDTWHRRYGHLGVQNRKSWPRKNWSMTLITMRREKPPFPYDFPYARLEHNVSHANNGDDDRYYQSVYNFIPCDPHFPVQIILSIWLERGVILKDVLKCHFHVTINPWVLNFIVE